MRILSFDIEDWFHLLDNQSTKSVGSWIKFETRIHQNVDKIFKILDTTNHKATFFILGWVAEKYPEIVKKIHNMGYEIGSHSYSHQLVYTQSRKGFYDDLERSVKLLEDLTGKKIKYFRAPGFSITEKNIWSFEILHELGIEIDCSVFPTFRGHGGMPKYKYSEPSIINYKGIYMKELPINTYNILWSKIVFSGGGYFRLFPYFFIRRWTQNSDYVMTYFHPRDFDPNQPRIKELSKLRKFKSYVGLIGAEGKMCKWLSEFNFVDIGSANELIDWQNVKVAQL